MEDESLDDIIEQAQIEVKRALRWSVASLVVSALNIAWFIWSHCAK